MGVLRAEHGKIFCNEYMEIYIPMDYFADEIAINRGAMIDSFGVVYVRAFPNGKPGKIQLLNLPIVASFMAYETREDTIDVNGKQIPVYVLEYLKDAYVLHQTVPNGREIANDFLDVMLRGKIPDTINYEKLVDIWWRNLEISGVSFKVPSKIYEMVIAAIYRNPRNTKQRYGQYYGKQAAPSGLDYKTGDVRKVVKDLSTFSGMVFEDIGLMISNGLNNSIDGVEEPISPLEKIIHY